MNAAYRIGRFGAAIETIAIKHTRDYFDCLNGNLYPVGCCRNGKGQETDIVVQDNATDLQYTAKRILGLTYPPKADKLP